MDVDRLKGRKFWDANPIGGNWNSYKEKLRWALDTESYIYELLTAELLQGKKALDVGCGAGLAMPLSARYCSNVIGLDYSLVSLSEAKDGFKELNLNNAYLICGDAENLPFPDSEFDVIYSLGVLHHVPDTAKGVREIFRCLKPAGSTVIMLYKAYSPKGLAVKFIRALSWMIDRLKGEEFYIANRLRFKYEQVPNSHHGTALLELFGCPTLKMYSRRQAGVLFHQFKEVEFQCYQPGFSRLLDFLPQCVRRSILSRLFVWFDSITANTLGFYLVIRAKK